MPRNKFIQGGERLVHLKIQKITEEIKEATNEKTSCVHEPEDNIVKILDLMQLLSKYQWPFSQNQKKKTHLEVHMETLRTQNSQNNLEKEKQNWRPHTC